MESTANFVFKFESSLDSLARCSEVLGKKLSHFVKLKSWQSQDKQALLQALSELILDEDSALYITKFFKPIILEILQRCTQTILSQEESIDRNHEQFSFILSILLPIVPNIQSFILEYFSNNESFYVRLSKLNGNHSKYNDMILTITRTAYNFLHYDFNTFAHLWDWSLFIKLLDYDDTVIRWLAAHVVAMVTQMSDQNKVDMMNNLFTSEEQIRMTLEMDKDYSRCYLSNENDQNCNNLAENSAEIVSMVTDEILGNATFTEEDFTGNHIAVSGVVLSTLQKPSQGDMIGSLVMVPSTRRNLHSLAIAIATGCGVLLEGPVGSGKTCLVEYIAQMTGRVSAPALMKVQLGDQTDSKSLLGTYICTDTPGEFVWQAGTLLQAVQGGQWVLLEDIDYAPMDVVSVLIPLLESRMLSVPGHGNVVKAAPGFQLFATQRTHSSSGYAFHAHSNSSILDRLWTKVNVEPLTKEELNQVICMKFPDLSSVCQKLIDIYCMVSSDKKLVTNTDTSLSSLSHDKRLSTTRDLMKWTSRVSMSTSNGPFFADAKDVFLEAQDCFGATLSKLEQRLELGMAIGAKLGIPKEKVEFFCKNYKPKVHLSQLSLTVGRVSLPRHPHSSYSARQVVPNFAHTRHSLVILERVAASIRQEEPVLLVGETGTGKTSSVQNLAALCHCNLKVINMSQQSDSADLLGGFKPVDMKQLVGPVRENFEKLFCETFSRKQNAKYLSHIQQCYAKGQWEVLFKLMMHSYKAALDKIRKGRAKANSNVPTQELLSKWHKFTHKLEQLRKQQKHAESALAFQFVEGTLVKAIRDGDWMLLDEINLATPETLECLSGLLESSAGSVVLLERGDVEPIVRHDNFRLFACMNPATDVGKKDLPPGIRNRFTEIFVDELEDVNDLKTLVVNYLQGLSPTAAIVDGIVRFYLTARHEASDKLTDGTGHKPHYSLRTLCRALRYASSNPHGNVLRSIYEGFCLSFLTQLDRSSHPVVESLIRKNVLGHVNATSLLNQPLPCPTDKLKQFVNFEGFWVNVGKREPLVPSHYVLTASVKANLRDLTRVVSGRSFPVLIQGETSVGKTSLIQWLSSASGNQCVRINNHEHTDIQEYLGCYTSDHDGRLVFKEGVLVDAMRKGYWIILDELNLAPTDVLEALNRLLDDNRELFIAETQETVKAHPNFMLFATQNPPGQYGGRKVLSRAFRNRFVELHFDELPSKELEKILHLRGDIPMSYAKKMVAVMLDLQARRRSTSVFAGKQGFITLRDLFRWAERYSKNPDVEGRFHDWEQHLAEDGYMLLAGRCRNLDECKVIQDVLQTHFKRNIDPETLFSSSTSLSKTPFSSSDILEQVTSQSVEGFDHVVWTKSMKRLAVLVGRALQFREPVLLVGETGCGKTTICQLFSALKQQHLYSVNCHMHSESSDFLGGLRPVRNRHHDEQDGKLQRFFEWCDGPLVLAMKEGAMFLVDEISLADDSVLERLNSVLEPERTLVLAEKGSEGGGVNDKDVDIIQANDEFRVVATMNPGGDFGKKELSPALRNRFTEIWCPSSNSDQDLIDIIEHNLIPGLSFNTTPDHDGQSGIGKAMVEFVNWFHSTEFGRRFVVSIRDLLSWIRFINTCCQSSHHVTHDPSYQPPLQSTTAYLHGACLVFLDALGAGFSTVASAGMAPQEARSKCLEFLRKQVKSTGVGGVEELNMNELSAVVTEDMFGIKPFYISRGPLTICDDLSGTYALNAPTTSQNAQRLLRALQLSRPILLEGSPGVGKTSLVNAIAKASGHELVRINLSEQTDITDLFGADLPVEGGDPGMFTWRDGPLLGALKAGHWIVLDELNLASQSVLEGLNACLDHRAEVYIPELGMTFKVQHEKTRLFACQNPLNQGGGRKGLPKSFLNRFTQVYVEPLSMEDLLFITTLLYPIMDCDVLQNMITFNMQLHQETVVQAAWGKKGSPWEFNLRDVFRWCDLYLKHKSSSIQDLFHFAKLIYSDRMRTAEDKIKVIDLIHQVFNVCQGQSFNNKTVIDDKPRLHITPSHLQVGYSFLPRRPCLSCTSSPVRSLQLLHHDLPYMESLMKCIGMSWMTILVGTRSCGKTSLVQMTAELTGNKLEVLAMNSSMDTTELLGGFEQANLNIHWQSILNDAQTLVQSVMRMTLLRKMRNSSSMDTGNVDSFRLFKKWESFLKPSVPDNREQENPNDVADLNSTKIDKLIEILHDVSILNSDFCDGINADSLQARALDLKTRLKVNHGNTHCGGQFEWVDGQLVEALKSGYWLLIENVNFCSPSVLDRLNALLEPGGVLSINERGVIDGEVPSIKPHPDFRLILTMDPKFGEISRAMRNRGVEIYMSGEDDESTGYDEYDLQVMLNGAGVCDERTCQMLLAFHKEYKEKLGGSVLGLLHVATMITDLLHRGEDLGSAILTSLNQVYIRSHVNEADRQVAEDLVNIYAGYETILSDGTMSCIVHSPPSVTEFSENSTLATIKWHCAPIHQLPWKQQSPEYLQHAVNIVIERSSFSDWQLRCEYLTSLLGDNIMRLNPSQHDVVHCLVAMVKGVVTKLFDCPLMEGVKKIYEVITTDKSDLDILAHQPYDIRQTRHLHQQLTFTKDDEQRMEAQLSSLCNRLQIHCMRVKQNFMESQKKPLSRKTNQKTLLDISRDLHQGRVSMEMLPHPTVAHLIPFFKHFNDLFDRLIVLECPLSNEGLSKAFESLEWSSHLYNMCSSTKTFSLSLLSLHWQWFIEKTLRVLPAIMGYSDSELPSDLMTVIRHISQYLGTDTHLAKTHLQIATEFGHPLAFKSELVFGNWEKLVHLCQMFGLSWRQDMTSYEDARLANQLQFLVTEGPKVKNMLSKAMFYVLNEKNSLHNEIATDLEVDKVVEEVSVIAANHGVLQSQPNATLQVEDMDLNDSESETQHTCNSKPVCPMKVALLPLCEVIGSSQESSIVAEMLRLHIESKTARSQDICSKNELCRKLDSLLTFLVTNSTKSPLVVAIYRAVQAVTLQDENDLSTMIKSVESDLMHSLLTTKSHFMTSMSIAKWSMSRGRSDTTLDAEPSVFTQSDLDSYLFRILNNQAANHNRSHNNDSLSGVAIGNHKDKTEQLAALVRHIWSNADHVTNLTNQNRHSEITLFASKFAQVLLSLAVLMETSDTRDEVCRVAMAISHDYNAASSEENLEKISNELFHCYETQTGSKDGIADMNDLLQQSFSHFRSCVNTRLTRDNASEIHEQEEDAFSVHSGSMWVSLGLLQTQLLTPVGPVDPVEQNAIELQYVRDEINGIKQELEVRLYAEQLWAGVTTSVDEIEQELESGREPTTFNSTSNPQRVQMLAQKLKKARERERELARDTAVRPKPSQFEDILHGIRHYKSTIGSPQRVLQMMATLQQVLSAIDYKTHHDHVKQRQTLNNAQNIVQRVDTWTASQKKFMFQMKNDYPLYGDVIGPFVSAVSQVVFGITTLSSCLQRRLHSHYFLVKCPDMQLTEEIVFPEHLIALLCGYFLDKGNLEMAKKLMSGATWSCLQALKSFQSQDDGNDLHSSLTSRVLWTSLLYVRNHTIQQGYLNAKAIQSLLEILNHYMNQWTLAKDEEQKRQQEEESLFKFKTTSHEGEIDEEKAFEMGLCKAFPTFDNEFSEFILSNSLEEVQMKPQNSDTEAHGTTDAEKFIKNVDTPKISSLHEVLFCEVPTCLSWLLIGQLPKPSRHDDSDVELLQSGYQTASVVSVMNEKTGCFHSIGEYRWEPHLIQSQYMLQHLAATENVVTSSDKYYDVYHDSNIPEVIKVRPVMTSFSTRLNELLAEWPGNPILTQLQSFIDKILSLPVTSPLMKVLTGVELLLKNAQDWEGNASRRVSIKEHLDGMIQLIIEWRKLELRCWSSLLDVATVNISSKASKWWFYLYSLVQQTFATDSDTDISELIDPLQRFLESSSLGEFSSRLKMLYSFYQQCITMEIAMEMNYQSNNAKLSDVILNIYSYYKQFSEAVQQRVQQARDPIEKELKGYVKIAKWNDSNFWAMKQATEKSHRTLHKFVRRHEMALSEPVRQLLMDSKKVIGSIQQDSVEVPRDNMFKPDWFISPEKPSVVTTHQVTLPHEVTNQLERLPKLFSKMKKLCHGILAQQKYSTLVSTLDDLTGEIITSVHELQALDVSNQAKEKRKEMRKHIHLRKRTSLAELFKVLSSLGLSHKKGLQNFNQSASQDSSMLLPALDEKSINNLHADMSSDIVEAVRHHANRCQHYYYRCLARMSALHVHMASPSKELTMGDIHRCKGYTHHLLRVVQNQRNVIIDVANSIARLRLASRSLTTTTDKERSTVLPQQDEIPHQMVQFMELLTWVHQILQRSLRLLNCCPQEEFTQDISPLPQSMLSAVATSSSNSEIIHQVQDTLRNCLVDVDKLTSEIRPHVITMEILMSGNDVGNYILASWKHIEILNTSIQDLKNIGKNIDGVLPHFTSSTSCSGGLGGSLHLLAQRIKNDCEKVESWSNNLVQDKPQYSAGLESSLPDKVDKTVTSLLLAVQRIFKVTESKNEESVEDEQDVEESLLEGHLVAHLHNNMTDEVTKLDLNTVHTSIKALISGLKDTAGATDNPTGSQNTEFTYTHNISFSLVSLLVPLLKQYIGLADSYLLNLLSAHQTCCKLLSVLLGVFTELAEKGFCLPPEMDEEESGEGATEFEDIQDGGLGEGEGAKDVSDQIENEDQLQDAKKDDQQEDKQDDNQQKIPEEESGIEMSEDFDGVMHDVEGEDEQEEENSGDEEDDEEPDKQMGELDGKEDETLDEKMWGDSDDEDDKEDKEGESEKGAGAEAETESEIVAKEDNKDAVDDSKEKEKQQNEQNEDEENIHEQPKEDLGNLSDEDLDPQGEGKDEQNTPEDEAGDLDLPENLEIDDENQGEEQNEGEEQEDEATEMPTNDIEEDMDVDEDGSSEENKENEEEGQQVEQEEDGQDQEEHDDQQENGVDNQDEGEEPIEDKEEDDWRTKHETEAQDSVQAVEDNMANDGGSDQNEVVEQTAGQSEPNDSQEQQGVGSAMAAGNEGHSGEAEVTSAQSAVDTKQKQRKQMNRSRSDRSLGSTDERTHKRLKTVEKSESTPPPTNDVKMSSDLYQHMTGDDQSKHDAQTFDSATADQTRQQDGARFPEHQSDQEDDDDDEEMEDSDTVLEDKEDILKQIQQQKNLPQSADTDMKSHEEETKSVKDLGTSSETRDKQTSADRTRSSYHVSHEALVQDKQDVCIDANKLRSDLEHQLSVWSNLDHGTIEEQRLAQSAWHKYELLTSTLAQELCEQLRLVLEPSLATKLKGDYRTGKRLNMRKVIPYIASQFRKDKIWLRRTKPSKREYQVMIAVDDSSSMADNHSKQLAFESLAVISKALTRLEAGDLGVCSFGETVKLLHPLHEQFTDQSGAKILQQFKFDQKKTKIAELVSTCNSLMISSRSRLQGGARSRGDTSQLLLVVSDGRGVFLEGMETVRRAVRAAKEAGIFLVFVIIDNPINRDSILDIKVPIFHPGKPPEIKSYIEQFPFPFYIILRDINSLPVTLSDALRQWFELVISMDN